MDKPNVEYNHPKDRGWAWVIVLAAAVANFVVNGGTRTIGLLIVELNEFFQAGATMSMVVTAFLAAGFSIFACIGNILGVRFTMRKVAVAGAICVVLGMFFTALAPNMITVILTLGMLSGMGYGFLFGPTMVLVGQYCPKRMSIANGLAVAGGSVGQLVLPFFIVGVCKFYLFRGGLLMYTGLILHVIPAMLLLRPPSFYGIKKNKPEEPKALEAAADNNNSGPGQTTIHNPSDYQAAAYRHPYQNTTYSLQDGNIQEIPYRPAQSAFFNPNSNPNYRRDSYMTTADEMSKFNPDLFRTASAAVPHTREELAETLNVPTEAVTTKISAKVFFRRCCDPVLIKNPVFIIYVLGLSLGHSGFIGACTCVAPYVSFLFGSKDAGATLMVVMGCGDLAGRLLGGLVAQKGIISKSSLVGGSFVISGFLAMLLPFFGMNYIAVMAFGALFGLLGGTYMAQLVAMADDLFGSALLASSIGLSTMIMGLVAIPIIPTLGRLAERPPPMKPQYGISVRVAGVIIIIGGCLFYVITIMGMCLKKKMKKMAEAQAQNQPQSQTNGAPPVSSEPAQLPSGGSYPMESLPRKDQVFNSDNQNQMRPAGVYSPTATYFPPPNPQRDGIYQPMQPIHTSSSQGAFPPHQFSSRPGDIPASQSAVFYPPGSMPRGPSQEFQGIPGGAPPGQYAMPGGPDRWSKQDFRWSKIPISPESNL